MQRKQYAKEEGAQSLQELKQRKRDYLLETVVIHHLFSTIKSEVCSTLIEQGRGPRGGLYMLPWYNKYLLRRDQRSCTPASNAL